MTKHKQNIVLIFLLIIVSVNNLECQETKFVSTQTLNVRENASKNSKILDKITYNDEVKVISTKNDWSEIETKNGIKGFVFSELLTTTLNQDSTKNKETSWLIYAIAIITILFIITKLLDVFISVSSFFERIFKGSKNNSKTEKRPSIKYLCEYCGQKFSSVQSLSQMRCHRHPLGDSKGVHKLFEGGEKSKYICKYCGISNTSLDYLTLRRCNSHPNGTGKGYHEPAL